MKLMYWFLIMYFIFHVRLYEDGKDIGYLSEYLEFNSLFLL